MSMPIANEILEKMYVKRVITYKSAQGLEVSHQAYLDEYIRELGQSIRMFLPLYESDPPVTAKYVTDAGPKGHHFTPAAALDTDPIIKGMVLAYELNGTDEGLNLPDHADFTFGNASADSAFSVGLWFRPDSIANDALISRMDELIATNQEWELLIDAAGKLNFHCYDDSVPAYVGRLFNTALTARTWYFVVATYDATEASSGIKIYLAAYDASSIAAVDDTDHESGVYVAMENKTVLTTVGYTADSGAGAGEFMQGALWGPFVVAEELSSTRISTLFALGKKLLGFDLS